MFATPEEFAKKGKLHSIIMVIGNPAPTFNFVGSAHRLWGPEPHRVEVWDLPDEKEPPAVKVRRFAGTPQEIEEDIHDPDRIGLRSLREMRQPGSRLSILGDGESVSNAGNAEVVAAKAEVGRLASENTALKAEVARLGEELGSASPGGGGDVEKAVRAALGEQSERFDAAYRQLAEKLDATEKELAALKASAKAETVTTAETPSAKAAEGDKSKGKPKG